MHRPVDSFRGNIYDIDLNEDFKRAALILVLRPGKGRLGRLGTRPTRPGSLRTFMKGFLAAFFIVPVGIFLLIRFVAGVALK